MLAHQRNCPRLPMDREAEGRVGIGRSGPFTRSARSSRNGPGRRSANRLPPVYAVVRRVAATSEDRVRGREGSDPGRQVLSREGVEDIESVGGEMRRAILLVGRPGDYRHGRGGGGPWESKHKNQRSAVSVPPRSIACPRAFGLRKRFTCAFSLTLMRPASLDGSLPAGRFGASTATPRRLPSAGLRLCSRQTHPIGVGLDESSCWPGSVPIRWLEFPCRTIPWRAGSARSRLIPPRCRARPDPVVQAVGAVPMSPRTDQYSR